MNTARHHRVERAREAVRTLYWIRNSCNPVLRRLVRDLLRDDIRQLRSVRP